MLTFYAYVAQLMLLFAAANGRTAENFSFTAVGDYSATPASTEVLSLMGSLKPSYNLALGDLSYGSIPSSDWCQLVKNNLGEEFPFELTVGNHETEEVSVGGRSDLAHLTACLPHKIDNIAGQYPVEYYFDFGRNSRDTSKPLMRTITISPSLLINGTVISYAAGTVNYNWVAQAIDDARARGIQWVVVTMHRNCLTMGRGRTCEIGQDLMRLLFKKRVDLVLQGHDHTYQRSKQLTCATAERYEPRCVADHGDDRRYQKGRGTVVVIVGVGGVAFTPINPRDSERGYFATWMGEESPNKTMGLVEVKVSFKELAIRFIGTAGAGSGKYRDHFKIIR